MRRGREGCIDAVDAVDGFPQVVRRMRRISRSSTTTPLASYTYFRHPDTASSLLTCPRKLHYAHRQSHHGPEPPYQIQKHFVRSLPCIMYANTSILPKRLQESVYLTHRYEISMRSRQISTCIDLALLTGKQTLMRVDCCPVELSLQEGKSHTAWQSRTKQVTACRVCRLPNRAGNAIPSLVKLFCSPNAWRKYDDQRVCWRGLSPIG